MCPRVVEDEDSRDNHKKQDGMRGPVSAGCDKLPRIDAL
jgi:hypothetical protein